MTVTLDETLTRLRALLEWARDEGGSGPVISAAEAEAIVAGVEALRAEYAALLDAYLEDLADSTAQGCQRSDGKLDSACLSTWTANIETLAKYGRVRIVERHGRWLVAEWISREERLANAAAALAASAQAPEVDGWKETANRNEYRQRRMAAATRTGC